MPRKAPKEVVEHRITFGDYERKELRDLINSYQQDKILENVPNIMLGTAGLVVAGTVGFVGYALYYWLDSVPSISDIWTNVFKAAGGETLRNSVMSAAEKLKRANFAKYESVEEINAAYDEIEAEMNANFEQAQQYITLSEGGKRYPPGFIAMQRSLLANEQMLRSKFATDKSDYISQWTAWKAEEINRTNNRES
jgi:hypothetical protein